MSENFTEMKPAHFIYICTIHL